MLLRLVGVHFNAEQQLLCQRTSWSELINLIHFVISTCIHSDYIFIYLCLLYSCYGYYSEPLLSTRCPLHSPVHTCAGANCSNYLDISYLRWRAGDQAAAEPIATSAAANRLIGKVVQSRPFSWFKAPTGCPKTLGPLCFLSFTRVLEHVQRNF